MRTFIVILAGCLLVPGCSDDSAGDNNNQLHCGNGVMEGQEDCDGQDLGGRTCEDLDFTAGTLGCAADCTFDTDGCGPPTTCGDSQIQPPEACDGTNLDGQTCESLGFYAGTLSCGDDCRFDTAGCDMNPCSCGDEIQGLLPHGMHPGQLRTEFRRCLPLAGVSKNHHTSRAV